MATRQNPAELCLQLEKRLAAFASLEEALAPAAAFLSETYAVVPDEVAFFRVEEEKGILRFLWPERLKKVGFLPLTSLDSLAARTVREKKLFVENNFTSKRHSSIFEKVRLSQEQASPEPIQKIMSVPIPKGTEIVGVIQVSRKAPEKSHSSVPDFSKDDLKLLLELARVLGKRF